MTARASCSYTRRSMSGRLRTQSGGTLIGVVIGFALGVGIAGLIAYALTKSSNPFDAKSARSDPASPHVSGVDREPAKSGEPRFDFTKILPGVDSRRSQEASGSADKSAAAAPATANAGSKAGTSAPAPAERAGQLYLQAGAYQNAADAEDQRAKLALMGVEASLQTVSVPDKGTLNRVRLGPFDSPTEMNQVKSELLKRGVTTAVIKTQ